jgi:hypothetical protein
MKANSLPSMAFRAGVFAWTVFSAALADEPEDKRKAAAERLEFMMKSVGDFQVVPTGEAAVRWDLYPKPLLRWTNPVGGVPDGIIVMWTDGVRPAILAQVFQTKDGLWVHAAKFFATDAIKQICARRSQQWMLAIVEDE